MFRKAFGKMSRRGNLKNFNYEGLIDHWHSIDPEIANAFQVEMQELLEKRG